MTGRQGKRLKQLLNDHKKRRKYWKIKEEHYVALCGEIALEGAMVLTSDKILFGKLIGPPVQTGPGAHTASYTMGTEFLYRG